MATPLFDAFIVTVRQWANRDEEVLTDAVIKKCMQFAADKAYRTLDIPPLEKTYTYEVDVSMSNVVDPIDGTVEPDYEDWVDNNYIPVPTDLTRFGYIRKVSGHGVVNPAQASFDRPGKVFNVKIDPRAYADPSFVMAEDNYFAVQDFKIRFPSTYAVTDGDVFEVFYYGRLPALDSEYAVSDENLELGIYGYPVSNGVANTVWTGSLDNTPVEEGQTGKTYYQDYLDLVAAIEADDTKTEYAAGIYGGDEGDTFTDADLTTWWNLYGIEIPNWLRDEQQKILLFGTLAEVGRYLGDMEMSQRFTAEFDTEMRLLNNEEQFRIASGAGTVVGYQGYGLL